MESIWNIKMLEILHPFNVLICPNLSRLNKEERSLYQ